MRQEHILGILYELALVTSGDTRSDPLLQRFLQRLMFHTGFPFGLYLESVRPTGSGPDGTSMASACPGCAIGDPDLELPPGRPLSLPRALVSGASAVIEDRALLERAFPGAEAWRTALKLKVGDDSVFLLLSPEPLRSELPLATMFDPVLRNFERVLALYRSSEARTRELEAANRELDAFSYSVSHDLRAPLRAIDGFSQALVEDYHDRLDEQGRGFLQRVRNGVRRMSELIDDLLLLSRTSQASFERETVDLSGLARASLDRLAEAEPRRGVDARVADGLFARADADLMAIALDNLLGNAWKYTGRQPRARIEFGSRDGADETVFFVRDNGAGFDMRHAGKLFAAFQRLHRPGEFSGTGIGLATVQRIIARHGGRIWAQAEPGKGATFFFTLPAAGRHDSWRGDHACEVQ